VTNCAQLSEPYKAKCDRSAYFSEGSTSNVYAFDIMLGSKALILANEIDNDISATEMLQVAQLQLAANSFNVAIKILTKTKERATNSLEYVNVVRTLGVAQATVGLTKDANRSFSEALGGFKTFGDFVPDDEINFEKAQTYLQMVYWNGLVNCDTAKKFQSDLDDLIITIKLLSRAAIADRARRNKDSVRQATNGACQIS
jgi:hypothetical protein